MDSDLIPTLNERDPIRESVERLGALIGETVRRAIATKSQEDYLDYVDALPRLATSISILLNSGTAEGNSLKQFAVAVLTSDDEGE